MADGKIVVVDTGGLSPAVARLLAEQEADQADEEAHSLPPRKESMVLDHVEKNVLDVTEDDLCSEELRDLYGW